MIIDAHTHFTTAPSQLQAYRGQQITNLAKPMRAKLQISDEELARSMQGQFKRMEEMRHRPAAVFAAGGRRWGITSARRW